MEAPAKTDNPGGQNGAAAAARVCAFARSPDVERMLPAAEARERQEEHDVAQVLGLQHKSEGAGAGRRMRLWKPAGWQLSTELAAEVEQQPANGAAASALSTKQM
jgi:hypothetical protein